MASIRLERTIDVSPEAAWDALRDFGALHVRLAPGFAVDCSGRTRFVWTTDLLPDHLAETTTQAMERGLDAIAATLAR